MRKAIVSPSAEIRSLGWVARSCIFCDGTQMSLEHVWPRWAAKLVVDAGAVQHRSYAQFQGRDAVANTYNQPPFQQTAKVVCRDCNNGWMSRLEEAAKPYLETMLHGRGRVLCGPAQTTLAAWALKTSMVIVASQAKGEAVIPPADHRYLGEHGKPPSTVRVWIGAYVGTHPAVSDSYGIEARSATDGELRSIWGTTLTFGPISFHVFGSDLPDYPDSVRFKAPWLHQIWPTSKVFTWTRTPCCSDQQLHDWVDGSLRKLGQHHGMSMLAISQAVDHLGRALRSVQRVE